MCGHQPELPKNFIMILHISDRKVNNNLNIRKNKIIVRIIFYQNKCKSVSVAFLKFLIFDLVEKFNEQTIR